MARILLVYGTTEGHTASIAERMASVMRDDGHEVEMLDSREARKKVVTEPFDGIVVGGSIHAGDYQSSLREFVKRNREVLERTPSAFFSVSLSAADSDEESVADTQQMIDKFIAETGWRPQRVENIAGALVYTQYNFFIKQVMKLIVKQQGHGDLDTSKDHDFTDWAAVERFAREFANSTP